MSEIKSSTHEDLEFDGEAMSSIFEDTDCWLVALDDWEIAVILSSLRYAHWPRRWRNLGGHTWDEIEARITQLEHCLMAGCNVGELLDKFDNLITILETLSSRFITNELRNLAQVTEGVESAIEGLELACGDTEVNFDTAAIVDAIEAQTTMQETRSIAEVTAQNTNFSDLVEAVDGLELVANCAPDVNVDCPPPVVNVQGGCGGVTGNTPEQQAGEEGGTPPVGTKEPTEIVERKCKVANLIYDKIYSMIQELGVQDVDTLAGIGLVGSTALIFAIIGLAGGPLGAIIGAVGGAILGIVMAIIAGGIDFDDVLTVMNNNHEDLVCSLYNSTTATQAREDFINILSDGGLSSAETAFLEYFLPSDVTNCLFFTPDSANGDALEAELDGYEGSVECGVCLNCSTNVAFGEILSGSWLSGGTARGTIYQNGGNTYYGIDIEFLPHGDCCPTITITNVSNWTGSINLPHAFYAKDCANVNVVWDDPDEPWTGGLEVGYQSLWSFGTQFTIAFTVEWL
jgi:hypothetical protein